LSNYTSNSLFVNCETREEVEEFHINIMSVVLFGRLRLFDQVA